MDRLASIIKRTKEPWFQSRVAATQERIRKTTTLKQGAYLKHKRATDPRYKLGATQRGRIASALRAQGKTKNSRTVTQTMAGSGT